MKVHNEFVCHIKLVCEPSSEGEVVPDESLSLLNDFLEKVFVNLQNYYFDIFKKF